MFHVLSWRFPLCSLLFVVLPLFHPFYSFFFVPFSPCLLFVVCLFVCVPSFGVYVFEYFFGSSFIVGSFLFVLFVLYLLFFPFFFFFVFFCFCRCTVVWGDNAEVNGRRCGGFARVRGRCLGVVGSQFLWECECVSFFRCELPHPT